MRAMKTFSPTTSVVSSRISSNCSSSTTRDPQLTTTNISGRVCDAMFASTNEVRGTSYRSRIDDPKYQFAGKTGTAQVKKITERDRELDLKTFQIPYEERDHALYIAYGPYKNPRYAVSILVEHGGNGSTTAAPMAKKLFKTIIDRHQLRESINNKKYLDI